MKISALEMSNLENMQFDLALDCVMLWAGSLDRTEFLQLLSLVLASEYQRFGGSQRLKGDA